MPRITEDTVLTLTTSEAQTFIRNAWVKGGRVRFYVRVRTSLPIPAKEGKCFPGYALIELARRQAEKLCDNLLGETLEGRGGRLKIEVSYSDQYTPVAFIYI